MGDPDTNSITTDCINIIYLKRCQVIQYFNSGEKLFLARNWKQGEGRQSKDTVHISVCTHMHMSDVKMSPLWLMFSVISPV